MLPIECGPRGGVKKTQIRVACQVICFCFLTERWLSDGAGARGGQSATTAEARRQIRKNVVGGKRQDEDAEEDEKQEHEEDEEATTANHAIT